MQAATHAQSKSSCMPAHALDPGLIGRLWTPVQHLAIRRLTWQVCDSCISLLKLRCLCSCVTACICIAAHLLYTSLKSLQRKIHGLDIALRFDCKHPITQKYTLGAALMEGQGRVLAFDRDAKRLARLKANARAAAATNIEARVADFLSLPLATDALYR